MNYFSVKYSKSFAKMSEGNWTVVLQNPQRSSVIYNSTLHQLRAVTQSDTAIVPRDNWTAPSYFQILSEILRKYPNALPLSLNDFLMNGYFDTYFPKRKKIGSGGCGSVFRVEHSLAGISLAVYACKVIPVGEFSWLQKVINEVKLLEKLNKTPHPLILGYKHCWIEEWQPAIFGPKIPCLFILMEFSELGSVEGLLATKQSGIYKQIPVADAWQIFISIILAVRHIHSLGILHRDLKLSNILMMRDPQNHPLPVRFVLSDFGTSIDMPTLNSKTSIPHKRTGATGTIETMAPELLVQDKDNNYIYQHSISSDIWSIGVMLFTLFFSVNPFAMPDGEQKLRNFKTIDQLIIDMHLENKAKEIPEVAMKFIQKTLVLDPVARMPIEQMIGHPFIMELIKHMNLNELVKADGPNVFVVSPSMEDLASSIPLLPLTMDKNSSSDSSDSSNFLQNNIYHDIHLSQQKFNFEKLRKQNELDFSLQKYKTLMIILFLTLLSVPFHSNILKYIHICISVVSVSASTKVPALCLTGPAITLLAFTFHLSDVSIFLILMMLYVAFQIILDKY